MTDSFTYDRWKSLEAGLAAMGSQAEAVLDCVEDEEDSGRTKPIDIEYLLSSVVPSVLSLSGTFSHISCRQRDNQCGAHTFNSRIPFLAGQRLCVCQPICQITSNSACWSVPRCSDSSD